MSITINSLIKKRRDPNGRFFLMKEENSHFGTKKHRIDLTCLTDLNQIEENADNFSCMLYSYLSVPAKKINS